MHRSYLVDPSRLDLVNQRGPSTAMACQLCAGVTGIEALKILLDRGDVKAAPWFHQFDAYTGRFVSRRLPGGSRHIGQRLKQKLGMRMMRAIARNAPKPQPVAACAGIPVARCGASWIWPAGRPAATTASPGASGSTATMP